MAELKAEDIAKQPLKRRVTWSMLPTFSIRGSPAERPASMVRLPPRPSPSTRLVAEPPASQGFSPMARTLRFVGKLSSLLSFTSPGASMANTTPQTSSPSGEAVPISSLTIDELIEKLQDRAKPAFRRSAPTWLPTDFSDTTETPSGPLLRPLSTHSRASKFLRTDPKGQILELRIETLLLQVKAFWISHDYDNMAASAVRALKLSSDISHPQYSAKICFYAAVAYFGLRDFETGQQFLDLANECKGIFREGELIDWIQGEALLFQKQTPKKTTTAKPIPSAGKIVGTGTTRRKRRSSVGVPPNIPGRMWHLERRNTSLSPDAGRRAIQSLLDMDGAKSRIISDYPSGSIVSIQPNVGRLNIEFEEELSEQGTGSKSRSVK